ncbi:MAG TPA: glycosyltransferase family 1 protein [Actinomycetota bacterium]|nr:glycosyltransferase family 1 protein [Actinomycetota bacterium]
MTKPRIGVNLLWLLPDAAGGAEEYAIRLLHALGDVTADTLEITLLCNRRFAAAHPGLAGRFRTAVAPIDGGSRVARISAESTWLLRVASTRHIHLIHHLNNVVPWLRNRPSVATIHDLRPMELPDTLDKFHGAYLRTRLRASARRAAVITTPTEFVRETVIELLGADPERVHVVSAPVASPAVAPSTAPEETSGAVVGNPFFLYPAITNPHKNHLTLLEAFADVAADHEEVGLFLPGAPGAAEDAVTRAIDDLGLTRRIRRLGRVSPGRLATLVRDATALVYPSMYEGFGLPLVEAMAAGCPVIASDRTALPEVVGEAGILVDPGDPQGWADAMRRLLEDEPLRARLITAGRERVRTFTQVEAARRQVAAYRLALETRRGAAS